MSDIWPWLLLAGLGAFHGLNPAMGWLFAVALGLHRSSLSAVFKALPPIAFGHALSIAVVAGLVVFSGVIVRGRGIYDVAGTVLIAWAVYHQLYGHRHRVRVGMMTNQAGLVLWSFFMATAHGAGLMILPALIPLCLSGGTAGEVFQPGSAVTALAAVGLHTGAMLAVTGAVAFAVYQWIGLAILRTAWLNVDLIWTLALAATGIALILTSGAGINASVN
jgi:hypothetical protein